MKILISVLILAIIGIAIVFWYRPFGKESDDPAYNYFPRENIYFHIDSKRYYGIDSSTNKWVQKKFPRNQQDSFGKSVSLMIYEKPAWKENEKHRLIYGTSLYTSSEEVLEKFREDSLKSLPPKKPIPPTIEETDTVEEEKKRSGFRRFIDKIFKKKE